MANNSNASPEVFGFDFQVNATIFLLLDNIKELKTIRMEGASNCQAKCNSLVKKVNRRNKVKTFSGAIVNQIKNSIKVLS